MAPLLKIMFSEILGKVAVKIGIVDFSIFMFSESILRHYKP